MRNFIACGAFLQAMRILVLLNAAAGSAGGTPGQSAGDRIRDAFAKQGVESDIEDVAGRAIAPAAAAFAKSPTHDALVVAGGDGTISAAAGALADSDVAMGVLPMGTLNHFAKDLGIPPELEAAAGIIAAGHERRIDVAELNGRVFINNSSVGLYPFMVKQRNADQKQLGRSKLTATVPAALRTLFNASSWHRLGIVANGTALRLRTPCVFVGNNPYEVDLSTFGTRKSLDSGILCVHVVRQQTWLGILLLPFKVALGLADPLRDIENFNTAEVGITSRSRHLHVSLDGEVVTLQTPLRYRSRPLALRVLAPPEKVT